MKKTIITLLVIALILPLGGFAAETLGAASVFDAESGKVFVSGEGIGTVIVRVVPAELNESDLNDEIIPIDIIAAFGKGEYETSFCISEENYAKRLKVYVTDTNGNTAVSYFVHPDLNTAEALTEELGKCADEESFSDTADKNAEKLGIDRLDAHYASNRAKIYKMLYLLNPKSKSFKEFSKNYSRVYALTKMNGKKRGDVEEILKVYASSLGIDFVKDYAEDERLTEKVYNCLCKRLADADFSKELKHEKDFLTYLEKEKAVSAVTAAEKWQDIERIIEKDFGSLFDLTSGSVSKQKVYSKMMSMKYNSFSDIEDNFKAALRLVNSDEKPKTSGGGSSGGTGATVDSKINIEIKDGKKEDENKEALRSEKKPMAVIPESFETSGFADIPDGHWCSNAVSALKALGIVSGYGDNRFMPENYITRAEFTKLIVNAFGLPSGDARFSDVPKDLWYAPFVGAAASWGIIKGYDGRFSPEENITRQDAAVICYSALKKEGIVLNGTTTFKDSADISLYAVTALGAFEEYGIILGDGENVRPLYSITRAEAVQLIYKTLCAAG